MRPSARICAFLALILGGGPSAGAHDLLIDPSHDHLDARTVVSMELFLGHPGEAKAVKADPEAAATYVCITPDGKRHVPGRSGEGLGVFDAKTPGLYVFAYATRPRLVHAATAELLEVVADAGAAKRVRREIANRPAVRPWRLEERHNARSDVVVGKAGGGKADQPVGLGLELVLSARPDTLRKGKAMTVRLLRGGKPLAGARVVAHPRKTPEPALVAVSDAKGVVRFTPKSAGGWAVRAVRLERAPRKHAAEWLVERATLTFEVPLASDRDPERVPGRGG